METDTFESSRTAHFEQYGFRGEGQWLSAPGGRTYALVREGDGRPVVLIHGGLSQAGEWAQVAGLLRGPVVVPDRPGWGLSDRVACDPESFRLAQSAWLLGLLDSLGVEEIALVGASIGAYVCLAFAHDHPDRVHALITVGAPAGLERRFPFFLRLMGNPLTGPLLARMEITDPEVNRKRVFANLVAHPDRLPVDVLQHDVDAMSLPGAGRHGYELMQAMSTLRGFRPEILIGDDLPNIETRSLVLWGDKDNFIPVARGRELAATMPRSRFESVPDTGHSIHLEHPDLVADRIATLAASR